VPNARDAWQIADAACRGIAEAFNAYGQAVRAEPVARDYVSHWGFLPTLGGRLIPHSVPLFVDKATGQVLSYGTVPRGGYADYIEPDARITSTSAVCIQTEA
jgi:hypothetical protein